MSRRVLIKFTGDVFCIRVLGHVIILINSFEAADTLLNKRSIRYSSKPRRRMGELAGLTATLPFMDPGPLFQNARRHFHRELSARALSQYYPDLERASKLLVQNLASDLKCERVEEHIDRSLGVLFMKVSSGYAIKDDDAVILASIRQLAKFASEILGGTYVLLDRIPLLCSLPRWTPGQRFVELADVWKKRLTQITETTVRLVKEDLVSGTPSTSFMGNVYASMSEGTALEEEQFKYIAVTMAAGGMLPLQSATLTFLYAMARHPEVQKRAQDELDRVLGGSRLPVMADREALPYITALIREVYRWVPVAPLIARKVLQDDEYNGYRIPKGATIVANNWAITRDPSAYKEPRHFCPKRFLGLAAGAAHGQEDAIDPLTYAFGYGRRICPGLEFAEAILFANISHMLTLFDILPANADVDAVSPNMTSGDLSPNPGRDVEMKTTGAAGRVEAVGCVIKPRSLDALALLIASTDT
ncbi:hypothetical protein AcV5_003970 [Taiwanofungus camphoratus]|nr:hypothetical protein AcV5_003970 [Antrodia cinnamomea]